MNYVPYSSFPQPLVLALNVVCIYIHIFAASTPSHFTISSYLSISQNALYMSVPLFTHDMVEN